MTLLIPEGASSSQEILKKIKLIKGDIATQDVDAVFSLLPTHLKCQGRIHKAILRASGTDLDLFILNNISKPKVGDVYALPGFELPAQHIIYGIMPVFRTEFDRDDKYLFSACRKSLLLAGAMRLQRIAIPPLGFGRNAYPKKRAARLIVQAILDRMDENFIEIRLVCSDQQSTDLFAERLWQLGWSG
jgi:O-acetyl-ADP-ribose deacetylase (regulator of RNase III)